MKLLVRRVRQSWPHTRIIFRGDSGFCRDRTLSWCDRNEVWYVVGIAKNEHLKDLGPLRSPGKRGGRGLQPMNVSP